MCFLVFVFSVLLDSGCLFTLFCLRLFAELLSVDTEYVIGILLELRGTASEDCGLDLETRPLL